MSSSKPLLPNLTFFQRAHAAALKNPSKPAIIDARTGKDHTYVDLLKDAAAFRDKISKGEQDINEARVAALVPNGCASALFQEQPVEEEWSQTDS